MKSLLILPRIKVENANAISGLVYGFPAVTHFLGYVHAISRELDRKLGVRLGGCGIVCHDYHVQTYKGAGGEHIFSLSRNPLNKDGKTAPFTEEGKVRIEVSLVIECDFTSDDFDFDTGATSEEVKKFEELVSDLAVVRHLAGGIITGLSPVKFIEVSESEEKSQQQFRRVLRHLMPGFVLRDRSEVLQQYISKNPNLSPFEALLDFYTLKSRAIPSTENETDGTGKVKWENISKPCGGWIVPIQAGYRAISPLYDKGKVACARDPEVPFCFVEPIYGLAEWLGPHRIRDIESIIWRYKYDKDFYICLNNVNDKT